jgi:hypothetical protein
MNKYIIYKQDNGRVAIVAPVLDCGLTVEQIALKDVPFGKPFKIIDASGLPQDGSPQEAWVVDEADLTDGVGADYGNGSSNPFIMPEVQS